MPALRDLSIRRKLLWLFMVTTGVALGLAATGILAYEWFSFRAELVRNLTTQAEMIGANSTGAISFQNVKDAEEVLSALRSEPQVRAGCIYRTDGRVFALYRSGALPSAWKPPLVREAGHAFTPTHLAIFRPIELSGTALGTVYLEASLDLVQARLLRSVGIVSLVGLVSVLVVFGLASRLRNVISAPILHLADTMRIVSEEKNYGVRALPHARDELGQLITGFNQMLAQIQARDTALHQAQSHLEQRVVERTAELMERTLELQKEMAARERTQTDLLNVHKQLVETSRQAGMAEVASSVLHNVGNVLNSVNVCATLVDEQVRHSKVGNLAKAAQLLQEHRSELGQYLSQDPKGQLLPAYLTQLAQHLLAEQQSMQKELQALRKNLEHIKEIVAMQQSYAKLGGVLETLPLAEAVDDALRLTSGSFDRHDIVVERDLQPLPPLAFDKHKVLQILVNLLRNADYALQISDRSDKRVLVRLALKDDHFVQVSVRDNGVGIPPENLTRIFSHGFTTKRDGHGFGLHSGSLAAKEMGGELTVHSDGVGHGATFTLELPTAPATPTATIRALPPPAQP